MKTVYKIVTHTGEIIQISDRPKESAISFAASASSFCNMYGNAMVIEMVHDYNYKLERSRVIAVISGGETHMIREEGEMSRERPAAGKLDSDLEFCVSTFLDLLSDSRPHYRLKALDRVREHFCIHCGAKKVQGKKACPECKDE